MKKLLGIFVIAFLCSFKAFSNENLKTCLDGKYSILCKYDLLTESQKKQAKQAERRENLKLCLDGKYSILCKKELLTKDQKKLVIKAEKTEKEV